MDYEKQISENIKTNNKAFWNYVQSKTKTRESVGNRVDNSGVTVTEGAKKKQLYLMSSSPVSSPKKKPPKCQYLRIEVWGNL